MKKIVLLIVGVLTLFASAIETKLLDVDMKKKTATIAIDKIDVGISGFITHQLAPNRSIIVNSATVRSFDQKSKKATLDLFPFTLFNNDNVPNLKIYAQSGDTAILAFGYERGLLIAPSEQLYYTLTHSIKNEFFVHPDIFATYLSYKGHPTPLKEDFTAFCDKASVGLLFFYLEQNLYTLDCHTFKILNIQNAPLKQKKKILPFYSHVEEIEANWFGAGSDRLEDYEPYYYELLYKYNKKNSALQQQIRSSNEANVTKLAKKLGLERK